MPSPWIGLRKVAVIPTIVTQQLPSDPAVPPAPPDFRERVVDRAVFDFDVATNRDRSLREYIRVISYGKALLDVQVFDPVTVAWQMHGNPRVPNPGLTMDNAIAAAIAVTPDVALIPYKLVVFHEGFGGRSWAFYNDGSSGTGYVSLDGNLGTWAMEVMHMVTAFGDLYNTNPNPERFDNMACSCGTHPSTYTKLKLGWLDPSNVPTMTLGGASTFTLHALALPQPPPPGRVTAVRIPSTISQRYFLVEARTRSDLYDQNTPEVSVGIPSEGVVVYEIDESNWPVQLRTPIALSAGQIYSNAIEKFEVKVNGQVPGGFTVSIVHSVVHKWNWTNMDKPQTANIRGLMGAVTARDTPTSPERPHVFVEGNDFNLWCRWSDGAAWNWTNMDKPSGVNITGLVGAVSVMDTPTSPERPHLFVVGNDGNVWCRWSSGTAWSWTNLGKPQTANIRGLMGAVTARDTPTSPERAHVFVEGNDFNLWCLWWSGATWSWLNMGKPSGVNIIGLVGAVSVMDTPTSPERPHLFVAGNDGNVWCRWLSGTAWTWTDLGKPAGANIRGLIGAVTVMDTPTSPQRAHVFVEGNDGNLWVDWWG